MSASAAISGIIIAESSLSFLRLGVTPGTPSWGADLSGSNRGYFLQALRDVLDPRLRGSGRSRQRRRDQIAAPRNNG